MILVLVLGQFTAIFDLPGERGRISLAGWASLLFCMGRQVGCDFSLASSAILFAQVEHHQRSVAVEPVGVVAIFRVKLVVVYLSIIVNDVIHLGIRGDLLVLLSGNHLMVVF